MKKLIYISLALLLSVNVFSQEVLTLENAIAVALENNHGISMAKNNAEIMANNAKPGNAGLLPQIYLSAGINYANGETSTTLGTADYENTSGNAGINLSYTLFDGLGTVYTFENLKLNATNGELLTKYTIENTIVQLISSYYMLASYKDNVDLTEEMLSISKERLERAKVQKEFGTTSGLNVLSAEVDFNNDSISLLNAIKAYAQAKKSFNVILGEEISKDFNIEVSLINYDSYELENLLESALQNNTSFQMSKLGIDQAVLDQKMAGTSLFPSLSLSSSYGYTNTNTGFSMAMDDPLMSFSTGLSLSYNLFNGGQSKTKRQNAIISLENAKIQVDRDQMDLEKNLVNALLDYENSLAVLAAEQQNIQSAQLNFDQSKEYFQLGQISSTQFREAQLNLIRAKTNINTARYSANIAQTELKKSSGILVF